MRKSLKNQNAGFLMISYHCTLCDKEFIEKDLAAEHKKETRHEIIKRELSR